MAEPAPLEVTAVVVERAARDPAAELQAQLEEAKAAAMAAADRMQSLLLQMAVMETAAAERRLAELNVRAELNRQQLACGAQQAAAASTSHAAPAAVTAAPGGGVGGAFVKPPQPTKADALTVETPDAKEAGAHPDDRHLHHGITMTDIFDDPEHKDDQAPIDTKLPFLLHDTSKPPATLLERAALPSSAAAGAVSKASASNAEEGKLGTLMGVFVPCLQNILGTIYFLRLSWIVALQGVNNTLLAVGIACATTFCTSLSLSAIATNGAIKSGGPYYLISRALGPEFGGAVGLCFYMGTTVAGAMYILGAVETLKLTFPGLSLIEGVETCTNQGEAATSAAPLSPSPAARPWRRPPLATLPPHPSPGEADECCVTTELMDYRVLGAIILVLCTSLVGGGVKYVSIVSPLFLIPVVLSIACILLGIATAAGRQEYFTGLAEETCGAGAEEGATCVNVSAHWSGANDGPAWTPRGSCATGVVTVLPDWTECFALFFPSVTGIMAGSNRSGDLRNAQRSIPLGTVCAVLLTSSLYLLCSIAYGGVAERGTLTGAALFTAEVALPPPVVQAGITLSTLGAGLQSLTGAPRLLQAIANDNLIPALHWFRGAGEPRRALLCTFCICFGCVMVGNLDPLSPLITMFFLLCYTAVNASVLIQEWLRPPNWRPRFRYYHPATALLGLCLCLFIMFASEFNRFCAIPVGVILLICVLYKYIEHRKVAAQWGDSMRGLRYQRARNALLELEKLGEVRHTKNWRPQVLLFCKAGYDGMVRQRSPAQPSPASAPGGRRRRTTIGGGHTLRGAAALRGGGRLQPCVIPAAAPRDLGCSPT